MDVDTDMTETIVESINDKNEKTVYVVGNYFNNENQIIGKDKIEIEENQEEES